MCGSTHVTVHMWRYRYTCGGAHVAVHVWQYTCGGQDETSVLQRGTDSSWTYEPAKTPSLVYKVEMQMSFSYTFCTIPSYYLSDTFLILFFSSPPPLHLLLEVYGCFAYMYVCA